ncbi:helix-turn-helix domain-containing protein [Sandaracinobacter sp. RS1-74]|uniref:helix-turn-helix transcriptional regulator n=1 Tax=Sandaracinobacteroides sayramensis TaxID=2913411 RepID=UPI001EDB08A8|nr:helix-turn-helix domain-containing protein [Sandaracinobacteroides sayramensis]MCG2839859.1 helix-turn-helix domain-containing protein [Sandaracinobacteroides sayramensis]
MRAAIAFRDAVAALGDYNVIISDNIATRRPMADASGAVLADVVFGFQPPEEQWWRNGQLALQSPMARACRYEGQPFWANSDGFFTRHHNIYLDALSRSDFDFRSLFTAAIVVPVHLPFGQIGMAAFGVADRARRDLSAEFEANADQLMLLTHPFITSYTHVTRRRQWLPTDCQLTKREVECLRWAAVGKTDKEISIILSRSHATVRFHIQNAGAKLDAVNRSQTVFKAAQLGFIGLAN